ncbi:MAG: fasciclin domain-containing protein [Leptolyngbyaceae bacterium]|nr:fasciclin domain-containing protein [Leptolyngbyaceae bacterium]
MNSLKNFLPKIAVLAGIASMSSLAVAPALADNHLDSSTDATQTQMDMGQTEASMTIVDVASGNESFNTLVQAVQQAGLAETLMGEGPYTVFAPTDEAFSQLPDGALDYLLQPENRDLLQQVLTYHVVSGEVTSNQIATGPVEALGGGLAVRTTSDGVIVNNASVVNADIQASNGVIHAVNRVLLPETLQQALASRLGVQSIYQ